MPLLTLDALPSHTTKGTVVRLLIQVGGFPKERIGIIELSGKSATVDVPADWIARLVKALDGTPLGNHHIRARIGSQRGEQITSRSNENHFDRLGRLLELESAAEKQRTLERARRLSDDQAEKSGESLVGLVIRDETTGLGGRTLVTLAKRDQQQGLPWTRLNVGSPILLSEQKIKGDGWRGIVCDRDSRTIQIALNDSPESEQERPLFRLDLSSDEVARQRQLAALERARVATGDRLAKLRDVLLGERPVEFRDSPPTSRSDADNSDINAAAVAPSTLNLSQIEAVRFALSATDAAIIHGPPGTGKTTTVVELIRQAVRRGERVLACAPSNLAVDNIFERLLRAGEKVVRLGHPARVLPELRSHTLDLIVENHNEVRLARKLVREAYALRDKAAKWTRGRPEPGAKQQMREEARQLLADARRMETLVVKHVLDSATVLCATTTSLDSEILGQRTFDLAVIDEACQTTEPSCWIPLLRCDRLVLAGDHCQLPPTIISPEAARDGFGISLMQRLIDEHGTDISRRLTTQYRMHSEIMTFSSNEFYEGSLVAHETVDQHLLRDLPNVEDNDLTSTSTQFVDTAGASYDEETEPGGESRFNSGEAGIVERKVAAITAAGLPANDIAVIAPYAAQVRRLREKLSGNYPGLEIDTVDGFQGREKEAVIISLVRSNPRGEIGFLADERRMNVALTRARRKLIVIGDSATIAVNDFYQRLLDYFQTLGTYRSVWEEL